MSTQQIMDLNEKFIAGWNAQDIEKTLSVLSDDAVWLDIGIPEPMRDKEAMGRYVQSWFTAFPDLRAVIKNQVVNEDQAAVEVEFNGINTGQLKMAEEKPAIPATGKKVNGKGVYFCWIKNGKVSKIHTYPDVAGLMMQLGLMG